MKWLRVVIRVPTSTHSNGLRRVISTDKIQSNPWVAVDLFQGKKPAKNHHMFLQMLSYQRVNCRKKLVLMQIRGYSFSVWACSATLNIDKLSHLMRGAFERNINTKYKGIKN